MIFIDKADSYELFLIIENERIDIAFVKCIRVVGIGLKYFITEWQALHIGQVGYHQRFPR